MSAYGEQVRGEQREADLAVLDDEVGDWERQKNSADAKFAVQVCKSAQQRIQQANESRDETQGKSNDALNPLRIVTEKIMQVNEEQERPNASSESPLNAQGWRPIETAPRDGTRVLIAVRAGVVIASWSAEAAYERFETNPGWQVFNCEDGFYSWAEKNPTHWMPLPEPPDE